MVTANCLFCNKEYNAKPSQLKNGKKYCSYFCYTAHCKQKNTRQCKICGKPFVSSPSVRKLGYGVYCSHVCQGIDRKKTVIRICEYCGKEFKIYPAWIRKSGGKYCSRTCKNESLKNGVFKNCVVCGNEFYVTPCQTKKAPGKYCSLDCAYTDRHTGKTKSCVVCGKLFYVTRKTIQKGWGNCCSKKCRGITTSGINNPACDKEYFLKHGKLKKYGKYCSKFNNKRKKAVRDFFGNTCICSGELESDLPYNLSIHHIDHDKEQGCNGKPFNLVPMNRRHHGFEGHHKEEYAMYINKTLREGFKWGIWNEQEYIEKVMYDE